MAPEDNPFDDRYEIDICIEEIKSLQQQLAAVTARFEELASDNEGRGREIRHLSERAEKAERERDEAVADNAVLIEVLNGVTGHLRHSDDCDRVNYPSRDCTCGLRNIMKPNKELEPHPGAALLERVAKLEAALKTVRPITIRAVPPTWIGQCDISEIGPQTVYACQWDQIEAALSQS